MSCIDEVLVEKRGHARLISDHNVIKGHRTGKMGWGELIFHRLDRFPELSGIRATRCKFIQEMRNFGFSDCLGAFVSTLPEGQPIGRRLGRTFRHKVFFWRIKAARSRENQGLKRSLIRNFMSGACLLIIWPKVDLK